MLYENLNVEEKAKWMSLLLAVDEIDKFCSEKGVNFDNLELKPLAIKHYINSTYPKIMNEIKNENIKTATNKIKKVFSYACDVAGA